MSRARRSRALVILTTLIAACGGDDSDGGVTFGPAIAARAAVLLSTCGPAREDASRTLASLYLDLDVPREPLVCLGARRDGCQALAECLRYAVTEAQVCTAGCEGSVRVQCLDGSRRTLDCASYDMVCWTDLGGPRCIHGQPPAPCDPETFDNRCEGGRPLNCDLVTGGEPMTLSGPVCPDLGVTCTVGDSGLAMCRGSGATCAGSISLDAVSVGAAACAGADIDLCVNGGVERFRCADLTPGSSCTADPAPRCSLGATCMPGEHVAACDGDAVVLCNAGRIDRIGCADLGLSACQVIGGVAGCAP